jgi:hypothetical protein
LDGFTRGKSLKKVLITVHTDGSRSGVNEIVIVHSARASIISFSKCLQNRFQSVFVIRARVKFLEIDDGTTHNRFLNATAAASESAAAATKTKTTTTTTTPTTIIT